jgi:hypothetical protein
MPAASPTRQMAPRDRADAQLATSIDPARFGLSAH